MPNKTEMHPAQIRRKDLTLWQKTYIPEIFKGMALTMRHMFRPKFTRQYPEERWNPPASFRGRPVLVDEEGTERCVACGLCARVCPALAIEVQAGETPHTKERYPERFEINMLRCIFCGDCEEACPKEAIFLTDQLVESEYEREEFIYGKDLLVEPVEKEKRVDISKRQTNAVLEFKKNKKYGHNK
jgi:NADH-quinone oxidoreductase subunit I